MRLQEIHDFIRKEILFEKNDKETRKRIEDYFGGSVICNEQLNPPEVVDQNKLVCMYNGIKIEIG